MSTKYFNKAHFRMDYGVLGNNCHTLWMQHNDLMSAATFCVR